jgi:hypothetical protein
MDGWLLGFLGARNFLFPKNCWNMLGEHAAMMMYVGVQRTTLL